MPTLLAAELLRGPRLLRLGWKRSKPLKLPNGHVSWRKLRQSVWWIMGWMRRLRQLWAARRLLFALWLFLRPDLLLLLWLGLWMGLRRLGLLLVDHFGRKVVWKGAEIFGAFFFFRPQMF